MMPATAIDDAIYHYLLSCRELNQFCSQNGWIDNDTLGYEILSGNDDTVLVSVTFTEVVMEGAGCVAGRVPCYGRLQMSLENQQVAAAIPV